MREKDLCLGRIPEKKPVYTKMRERGDQKIEKIESSEKNDPKSDENTNRSDVKRDENCDEKR